MILNLQKQLLVVGFIKSTDHIIINHRPTYPPIHIQTIDPPTHRPNNHWPNDKLMFKRLENMKKFILPNLNTAGGLLSIWIGSKSLIERITFITLKIRKRNGWVYILAFRRYCFIPPQVFVRPYASLFYLRMLTGKKAP